MSELFEHRPSDHDAYGQQPAPARVWAQEPLASQLLGTESNFYAAYDWCFNLFPTVGEIIGLLFRELAKLSALQVQWQKSEVRINVYLLACAINDVVDDHLLGTGYDFSKVTGLLPLASAGVRIFEKCGRAGLAIGTLRSGTLRQWRKAWDAALVDLLKLFVTSIPPEPHRLLGAQDRLAFLLSRVPQEILSKRIRVPAAFRSQDLTHFDILALAKKWASEFPDRQTPILVAGLRTAGSYFAPLMHAYLSDEGYADLGSVTLRPKAGMARWERQRARSIADRHGLAVIIDEPVNTGGTLTQAVDHLQKAGFTRERIVILLPIHQTRQDWRNGSAALCLTDLRIVTLQPKEWHKHRLLDDDIEGLIREYFAARRYCAMTVKEAPYFNAQLQELSEEKFHTRIKRVYEVRLLSESGCRETRYVLAKSVGWGWLGYHAFLTGERLSEFLPPLLGLRDGFAYEEWLPQPATVRSSDLNRTELIEQTSAYVAARVRALPLGADPTPTLVRENRHLGFEALAENLSRAYGFKAAAALKRGRIAHQLSKLTCPRPTLIDGKMRRVEWLQSTRGILKSDFEHHGLGKTELNMTDPAYDLAEAVLWWKFDAQEEEQLLSRYVALSADTHVRERMFLCKLIAGIRAMKLAVANLEDARLVHRAKEFNEDYIAGWNYLVSQTARWCASLCSKPGALDPGMPLVSMDIDGVLDKLILGFPSTTVAGMQAVSLLHAHGFRVAVNTARSVAEVKNYCAAFGFVGGLAEYGAYAFNALTGEEQVLVTPESLHQLEKLKNALQSLPGVFLNDDYQFSLRAYTFNKGVTVPLPTLTIQNLISTLHLDRLSFHQTFLDTAVLAREVDKGIGLKALLSMSDPAGCDTVAIGDSEADLPMFAAADRCFAPAHMSQRKAARALGCRFADHGYQRGLLSIVQLLCHPDGKQCARCRAAKLTPLKGNGDGLFFEMLRLADESQSKLLFRALFDPMAIRAFAV